MGCSPADLDGEQDAGQDSPAQEEVVPVFEERLKVGKSVVEQGHVRVRVYTVEHPVQEGVTLREERVAVERRPVDRPASSMPGEAFKDRTIDVAQRTARSRSSPKKRGLRKRSWCGKKPISVPRPWATPSATRKSRSRTTARRRGLRRLRRLRRGRKKASRGGFDLLPDRPG